MTAAKRRRTAKVQAVVTVEQIKHSGILYGPHAVVRAAINRIGCPSQYDHVRRAWLVPKRSLDDVLCAIELDGHRVDVQMAAW